jgi:CHASE3 domain sensor protein
MRNARSATLGFVVLLSASLVIGLSYIFAMNEIERYQSRALDQALYLSDIERLRYLLERKSASARAYLLTKEQDFMDNENAARSEFLQLLGEIRERAPSEDRRMLLDRIAEGEEQYETVLQATIAATEGTPVGAEEARLFLQDVRPIRDSLNQFVDALAGQNVQYMEYEQVEAERFATRAVRYVVGLSIVLLLCGIALAVYLIRAIRDRERAEQNLFQETLRQNNETQAAIRALREERDAVARKIAELLPGNR